MKVDLLILIKIVIISLLGYLARVFFILKYKWFGVDTFRNLIYAKNFKKTGRKIKRYKRVPYDTKYFLPGFPIFLSYFKIEKHRWIQQFSAVFDILNLICCLLVSHYYFECGIEELFSISIVYILSPLLIYQSCNLNARPVANFLFTLSIFSLIIFLNNHLLVYFFFSVMFSFFIVFFNRITVQSYVVVCLVFSIYLKSLIPLVALFLTFTLTLIYKYPYGKNLLLAHYELIKYFFKEGSIYERKLKTTSLKSILIWVPSVFFLPFFFNGDFPIILQLWFISVLVLSIVWIGGRGYFHLTNGMIPLSILSGMSIVDLFNYIKVDFIIFSTIITVLFIVSIISIYGSRTIKSYIYNKYNTYIVSDDLMEIFIEISSMSNQEYILPIPQRIGLSLLYNTDKKALIGFGSDVKSIEYDLINLLGFSFTNNEFIKLIKSYNVGTLLIHSSFVSLEALSIMEKIKFLKLIKNKNDYFLYKINTNINLSEVKLNKLPELCLNNYKPMGY